MQEHRFVAFPASAVFNEARSTAFDLNFAVSSLLDMLHIRTALADYLSTKVESRKWFEIDRDSLFGPFAL